MSKVRVGTDPSVTRVAQIRGDGHRRAVRQLDLSLAACVLFFLPLALLNSIPVAVGAQCDPTPDFGSYYVCDLSTSTETDTFEVNLNTSDRLYVRMVDRTGFALLQPDLSVVAAGTPTVLCSGSSASAAEINGCEVSSTGRYSVLASDGPPFADPGSYGIFFQRLNDPGQVETLAFGEAVRRAVSISGEVLSFGFPAQIGDRIWISMVDDSGFGQISPRFNVYDPDGDMVISLSNTNEAVSDQIIATGSGNHLVLAMDLDGEFNVGNFGICVQRLNGAENASALSYGELSVASLDIVGDLSTYTFAAEAGDRVLLRAVDRSGALQITPEIRLYDPTGTRLDLQSGSNVAEVSGVELAAGGPHTVLLRDTAGPDVGAVTLNLQSLNRPQGQSIYEPGVETVTDISTRGEVDWFSFTGVEGVPVLVRMTDLSILSPELRIYDPHGEIWRVASGSEIATIQDTIPESGDYLVMAFDGPPFTDDFGAYSIFIDAPVAASIGEGQSGSAAVSDDSIETLPNPFGERTTLRFEAPLAGRAHLDVYTVSGRLIRRVDVSVTAGWNQLSFAREGLPGGTYYYRLLGVGSLSLVRAGCMTVLR